MEDLSCPPWTLPAWLFEVSFARSSGPGGQNVNKVSSKVQLWFAFESSAIPTEVKNRLRRLAANCTDADGRIFVSSQKTRDQKQNIDDARQKIVELVQKAAIRPKVRRETKPTRGSQMRRLTEKKVRSDHKTGRRKVQDDG
jgi:ribosome-associated protein